MQLPEDITTAWSGLVTPERPFVVEVADDSALFITNLCVSPLEDTPNSGRVLLYVQFNEQQNVCLVPFNLGSFESTQISVNLFPGDKATFTIKGAKANISLIGYLINSFEAKTTGGGNCQIDPASLQK